MAAATLAKAFEEGKIEKRYLALVRGTPPAEGVVDYPIPKAEGKPRVPAVTRFRTVARSPVDRCSLVEAFPETGRLHQIRRHLRHIDHPLIGDVAHGSGQINRHYRATYGLHRLALHPSFLAFVHPVTGGAGRGEGAAARRPLGGVRCARAPVARAGGARADRRGSGAAVSRRDNTPFR